MVDFVVGAIVVVVVGLALAYLIKERKRGVKCIGCPAGGNCCSCKQSRETTSTYGNDREAGKCCGCHGNAK